MDSAAEDLWNEYLEHAGSLSSLLTWLGLDGRLGKEGKDAIRCGEASGVICPFRVSNKAQFCIYIVVSNAEE